VANIALDVIHDSAKQRMGEMKLLLFGSMVDFWPGDSGATAIRAFSVQPVERSIST
jgi:hypothetical protein